MILPVLVVPSVNVCLFVVPIVPSPVSERALLPVPEMEAVGVPPATFKKPNLALVVAVEPSNRSSVVFLSKILPLPSLKVDPPLATGKIPVTSEEARFIALDERTPPVE